MTHGFARRPRLFRIGERGVASAGSLRPEQAQPQPEIPRAAAFKVFRFAEYDHCPSAVPFGPIWDVREFIFIADQRRRFGESPWDPRYDPRVSYLNSYGGLTPEEIYLAAEIARGGVRLSVATTLEIFKNLVNNADSRFRAIQHVRALARR